MNPDEIRRTYYDDGLSEAEAFEAFDIHCVDNGTIGEVLGQDVASGYADWLYMNVK